MDQRHRMRIVGLTGGIATGKSTVTNIVNQSGVPVIDCDEIAHLVSKKVSLLWGQAWDICSVLNLRSMPWSQTFNICVMIACSECVF